MDAVIIGPSDRLILWREGIIKEADYDDFVACYGQFLADTFDNVIITPDNGVYTDIADAFSYYKKKKAVAFYPDQDSYYGIDHIKDNFEKYEVKPIEGDWYKLNADLTKKSSVVICVGMSPGTMIEIAFIKYHQKYGGYKDEKFKEIHLFIDRRTMQEKLPQSFHEQINNVHYFSNLEELHAMIIERKHILW